MGGGGGTIFFFGGDLAPLQKFRLPTIIIFPVFWTGGNPEK